MAEEPISVLSAQSPNIPLHCTPTTPFLYWFSSTFHTCVPTPLAFLSTLLGCLSMLSWLFAQLPQIVKNHRIKSTSGLSIYFLVEWCLGDMSNLFGAILTHQATWQVTVGAYYCFVDIILVGQWFWFEGLRRGQRLAGCWGSKRGGQRGAGHIQSMDGATTGTVSPLPLNSARQEMFHTPSYGTIFNNGNGMTVSAPRIVHAMPRRPTNPIPSPSPRTALLLTMVVALCSVHVTASPTVTTFQHDTVTTWKVPSIGTIFSWMSAVLYLLSRLPQLIKNIRRRSTAGLSPLLFIAAFLGNFFYSSSLIFNPCLWNDFGAYGGGGWVGPEGSQKEEWMKRALPFWLGAAGVLVMDASVGIQFWLWGGNEPAEIRELHTTEHDSGTTPNEPTGWMRGWIPSRAFSGSVDTLRRFSPMLGPRNYPKRGLDEQQRLLGAPPQ